MYTFTFTRYAKRRLDDLDPHKRKRILEKLHIMKTWDNFGSNLAPLHNLEPATHRLRIGQYRLILRREDTEHFLVLDMGHRSSIYR